MNATSLKKSAASILEGLKNQGGLDVKREAYDSSIVEDIQNTLGLLVGGDLDQQLDMHPVSPERFLGAVLTSIRPYALMMTDLLTLLQREGARRTNDGLAMKFNFESDDIPDLDFQLDHFREWLERWDRLKRTLPVRQWNHDNLCELNKKLRSVLPQHSNRLLSGDNIISQPGAAIQEWLSVYENGMWPDRNPGFPKSGSQELDEVLMEVWEVWNTVVEESKRYGRRRFELEKPRSLTGQVLGSGPNANLNDAGDNDAEDERFGWWSRYLLLRLDSDFWAKSILQHLYRVADHFGSEMALNQRGASDAAEKLRRFLDTVPQRDREVEEWTQILEDFLNLPIWKQRHELYAAWVFVQIHEALGGCAPRVHVYEDELLFSFSGSHLATYDAFSPRLHLFSEIRSPIDNPIGKGRLSNIQPDYRILPDPITRPEGTKLVVEVKQYLDPDYASFGDALTDYANGCPNAEVALVNYGRLTNTVDDYVDPAVQERVSTFGYLRPDRPEVVRAFREMVREALSAENVARMSPDQGSAVAADRRATDDEGLHDATGQVETVTLTWGKTPRDLDLHLFVEFGREHEHVYYWKKEVPRVATLDGDCINGWGTEEIRVTGELDGVYRFAVHNFSKDGDLVDADAEVCIRVNGVEITIQCPVRGDGDWWHVFTWNSATAELCIQNRITRERDEPR